MAKTVDVTDQDYDRLMMRAGHQNKIRFVIKSLLDLSDLAAKEIRKYDEWSKAVRESGGSTILPRNIEPREP